MNNINRFFSFRKTNQNRDIKDLLANAVKNGRDGNGSPFRNRQISQSFTGHSKRNKSNVVNLKALEQYCALADKLITNVKKTASTVSSQNDELRNLYTQLKQGKDVADKFKQILNKDRLLIDPLKQVGFAIRQQTNSTEIRMDEFVPSTYKHLGYVLSRDTIDSDLNAMVGIFNVEFFDSFKRLNGISDADDTMVDLEVLNKRDLERALSLLENLETRYVTTYEQMAQVDYVPNELWSHYDDLEASYDTATKTVGIQKPDSLSYKIHEMLGEVVTEQRYILLSISFDVLKAIDSYMYCVRDYLVGALEHYE
jgi:HPt (histidine-containing phosphotransfer) domain-containing protein